MAIPKKVQAYDALQEVLNEVLIQTGKALNTAAKDGKGSAGQAPAIIQSRMPVTIEKFHTALNELESDILKAKSVVLRDLNQVRARRRPPPPPAPIPVPAAVSISAPTPVVAKAPAPMAAVAAASVPVEVPAPALVPEAKAIAPPAPMIIDLDSPKLSSVPLPVPPRFNGSNQSGSSKPENKPVAPFPNMGLDPIASPEVTPAKAPTAVAKTKEVNQKNSPRPTPAQAQAAMTGRPASAPPKKETKVPPPQFPKSAASTPQPPVPASVLPPGAAATVGSVSTAVPGGAPPSANLFTDMAFSLAPASGDAQGQGASTHLSLAQSQNQSQHVDIDLTNLDSLGMENFDGNVPDSLPNLDFGIAGTENGAHLGNIGGQVDTTMFDLGTSNVDDMVLDYDLGGAGADKTNFNDLYSYGGNDTGEDFDFGI